MGEKVYYHEMSSPIGPLTLVEDDGILVGLQFGPSEHASETTLLLLEAKAQLKQYFEGKRRTFDIPFQLEGTEFQMAAWEALLQIPFGETLSYAEEAEMLGDSKKARAVGGANNKNPLPIIVPCHRVVGADGSLGGYQPGVEKKEWLLKMEKEVLSPVH